MSISAINSVNFTGKKFTKNGNEYDKTNVGKYAGMGVGTAVGAGLGINVYNSVKKAIKESTPEEFLNDAFTAVKERLDRRVAEPLEMASDEFVAQGTKALKRGAKVGVVVAGITGLLSGLGVGAIVDGVINHNRAKKADKTEA